MPRIIEAETSETLELAELEGADLTCALHYSRFDVRDGSVLDPPAELPLASFPVEIAFGRVVVEVSDGPITVNLQP